ncbi:mannose-P-dolichol utilization defect 1 protein isoform 2-T2 [Vipera latastei]
MAAMAALESKREARGEERPGGARVRVRGSQNRLAADGRSHCEKRTRVRRKHGPAPSSCAARRYGSGSLPRLSPLLPEMAASALKVALVPYLLPERCYEELVVNLNLLHVPCLKASLSKVLGLGVVAGSLVDAPDPEDPGGQERRGPELPFHPAGAGGHQRHHGLQHGPRLPLQTVSIGFMVQHFGGHTRRGLAFLFTYFALLSLLLSPLTPSVLVTTLQVSNMPTAATGRLLQAATNYQNGHTGQLSAITTFLLFAGSLARIFTSIQETGDLLMVLTYVVSLACHSLLLGQVLYYWDTTGRLKKE